MSTEAQIHANRANAQKSTGPKTEEGKTRSAQNARKHGLTSLQVFIPETRTEEFKSLHESLFKEVHPIGELQSQFFEQLVHASWNASIARELLTHALHQMDDRQIASANRYLALHERRFSQALKEIKALQTDLALRAMSENEPIAHLPLTCEINKITNEATRIARLPRPRGESAERSQPHVVRWSALSKIGAAFRPQHPAGDREHPASPPENAAA